MSCSFDGHAAGKLLFDFFGRGADQQRENRFFVQRFLQHGVVAAFVFAAENDQDVPGKCVERFQGGVDIGGLRIVVIAHAADFGDKFQAVLDAGERADAVGDRGGVRARQPGSDHRRQDIFQIVRADQRNLAAGQDYFFCAFVAKYDVVASEIGALRDALFAAEPVDPRPLLAHTA